MLGFRFIFLKFQLDVCVHFYCDVEVCGLLLRTPLLIAEGFIQIMRTPPFFHKGRKKETVLLKMQQLLEILIMSAGDVLASSSGY
ncbi:hypothetical protein FRX31_016709 [Thalictrum thalictroides]|uniref:Uncharacterized protein n=1 Tax=Thalictrum thalictroides TaxID=46969 RepID=A0A7J6W8F8_THATH|nr:hypothetical protein FRX31_016709 [Thalictrum thalictroides]